jgi:hypothetical protein
MYGFKVNHPFGAWGAGFDSLTQALEAAIEDAADLLLEKGCLIYLTREGEVIASYMYTLA